MKAKKNKSKKIIAATAVSLFSLMTVFVSTFAWFSMNGNADNNGMNLKISPVTGRLSKVYFHSYNDSHSDDNYFEFNKTPYASYTYIWGTNTVRIDTAGTSNDWMLEEYTALNHDHPTLMVFEFNHNYESKEVGDIYIKGHTTVNGFLGARQNNGLPVYDLSEPVQHDSENPDALLMYSDEDYDYYAFSSVAAFRSMAFSYDEYDDFLKENTGSTLAFKTELEDENDEDKILEEVRPFADVDNTAETFSFCQDIDLYQSDGSSTVQYIAVVVEYSPDAIGYIYTTYLGDDTLESWEYIFHFACDWSLEVS